MESFFGMSFIRNSGEAIFWKPETMVCKVNVKSGFKDQILRSQFEKLNA